jgi:UDP-GlcNAc:undecaprenyl-phosphate/decaprenyl-phosphate GlcNAc-1-phosphate transferase
VGVDIMNMSIFLLISSSCISFLITFYLVPLFASVAQKLGVMDNPDGNLKRHKSATPYLGGVAIYTGFITALALVFPFENNMFLFLVGSTLLLCIGLIDDIIAMSPLQKFIGQIIATFCFLKAGFYLKENFFSYIPNIAISFIWILSVINAFNLVDVMDGLSTLLASMATISFLICALCFGEYTTALLLAAFLGSLLAFLWFNKPQAKIYLGDAGSLFIGGFLATVPFMLPWSNNTPLGFFAPVIILLIPLLELGTLILLRTYKKIPFYQGSPDHFSIYLKNNGWSRYEILGFMFLFSLILLIISLLLVFNKLSLMSLITSCSIFICIWYLLVFMKKITIFLKILQF